MTKPIRPQDPCWLTPPNDRRHSAPYSFFECAADHSFDAGATAFSLVNASWLADAALLAYSAPDLVCEAFAERDVDMQVTPCDVADAQCYVAHDARKVIVAFRGTQVVQVCKPGVRLVELLDRAVLHDVLTDLNVRIATDPTHGDVHAGFLKSFLGLWRAGLEQKLTTLMREEPARTLWLTGHSLGGALATLGAAWLDDALWRDGRVTLYTYGSPRVGGAAFWQRFVGRPVYRFVHGHDIITTVPHVMYHRLPRRPEPFVHVGEQLELLGHGEGGAVGTIIPRGIERPPEPQGLFRDALGLLRAFGEEWASAPPHERVADHAPTYYASLLWNASMA